jgi:F-type H+-transporting ATPase subunit alpha
MNNFQDLAKVLEEEIAQWKDAPVYESTGTVVGVGDSVTTVYGLAKAVYGELIEFQSGASGIVMNLEESEVGVVVLSGENQIKDGEEARGSGRVVSVPGGDCLIGRVVDPLGRAIDGKGPMEAAEFYPIETPAAPVIERGPVDTPLETGALSIDAMIPIGRGQRELIIGDRQVGKTTIAIDAIINQLGKEVICIYCAIGQKASSVAAIVQNLEKRHAMTYTAVVLAGASDSAALQYIAPYAACAMAESFMLKGKDVLIVYDDLSKHAVAYRALSLLLRRPPGREAFPGDVFYLHSRLLERAAKLSPARGGGSITALPIIETQAGDISSYIPTNVISITDGQIFLDAGLFASGFRPAVDVGLSVSRVGGAAQHKAVRKLSGRLRLDLAQYREMAAFAQFGSDLDKTTRDKVRQGEHLMEALKQEQGAPYTMTEEALTLFIVTNEYLADVPVEKAGGYLRDFLEYAKTHHQKTLDTLQETKEIGAETENTLHAAAKTFAAQWKH